MPLGCRTARPLGPVELLTVSYSHVPSETFLQHEGKKDLAQLCLGGLKIIYRHTHALGGAVPVIII